jgi:hypothetical protein
MSPLRNNVPYLYTFGALHPGVVTRHQGRMKSLIYLPQIPVSRSRTPLRPVAVHLLRSISIYRIDLWSVTFISRRVSRSRTPLRPGIGHLRQEIGANHFVTIAYPGYPVSVHPFVLYRYTFAGMNRV